jgi:hypothetical protein
MMTFFDVSWKSDVECSSLFNVLHFVGYHMQRKLMKVVTVLSSQFLRTLVLKNRLLGRIGTVVLMDLQQGPVSFEYNRFFYLRPKQLVH